MPRNGAVQLLIVEDNPADVRLLKEALRLWKTPHCVHVADDGEEALDFVYLRENHAGAPRPDLVLLDLNLPKRSGIEVLCDMKANTTLANIPVIMFSSSTNAHDVTRAYDCSANCYITKPHDFDAFLDTIARIESFWLRTVILPSQLSIADGKPPNY